VLLLPPALEEDEDELVAPAVAALLVLAPALVLALVLEVLELPPLLAVPLVLVLVSLPVLLVELASEPVELPVVEFELESTALSLEEAKGFDLLATCFGVQEAMARYEERIAKVIFFINAS
jgi:hypothetical protein